MDLSVVVVTLNGRDALVDCLDALSAGAPGAERIVVNGPSTDGTTGMVREREDVDQLLELADRNVNVARNAGAASASGDAVAFVDERTTVGDEWADAVDASLAESAVATGPVRRSLPVGSETSSPEHEQFAGRSVTHVDGANVALTRDTVDALDGFDEYLSGGGARDVAHRLAGLGLGVAWNPDLAASRAAEEPSSVEAGRPASRPRNRAYVLAKNYGVNADAFRRGVEPAGRGGIDGLRRLLSGELPASHLVSGGLAAAGGSLRGAVDGLGARLRDRRPARNPNGISSRKDRVVRRYDWT